MPREMNNGFDEWGGYMEAKITKLEEQFTSASDPFRQSNLFNGISIYVNGRTNPSADELKRTMMVHGGIFHHYERSHTTYIIASILPDVKVRNMNTSKIISAQWVVDCVREKRILDYTRYLLYTNQKTTQPRLTFEKAKKNDETVSDQQMYAENEYSSNDVSSTVNDKKILSADTSQQQQQMQNSASNTSVARTANDPKFLSEFYNNSRLHHIATLGAGFKQYISDLRLKNGSSLFPARLQLKEKLLALGVPHNSYELGSCIMHIDMDCFFVSVGLRNYPNLRGQPVAVTHSKGGAGANDVHVHPLADRQVEMEMFAKRFEHHLHNNILSDKVRGGFDAKLSLSEIASCSYEARAKGLRNGMFVGHALKLCPELKTIPYDFEGYREVAFTLYDTMAQYTLNIEAVSCDEMFVDLTEVLAELQVGVMDFVGALREEVRQKTSCPCSAGVGANKLQARMATKRAKPDGQYHLTAPNVQAYMADIPIKELPGVGSSTDHTLQEAHLRTCGDLQQVSLPKLQMLLGKKLGETLQQFCRGIDNRALVYEQVRKSISAEVNYGIRFQKYEELETFLRQLCVEVHTRITDIKRQTKCVTLKCMVRAKDAPIETSKFMGHGVCDNITKSVALSEYTSDLTVLTRTVLTTMKALALPPHDLRGIGIQLSRLDDPQELKEKKENVIMNMFSKVVEKHKDQQPILKESSNLDKEKRNADGGETKNTSPLKQPTKNARGRPRGVNSNKTKKQANVIGMLKNAAATKQKSSACKIDDAIPNNIDPEVFAALPEDIRAEIINERKCQPKLQNERNRILHASTLNASELQPSTSRAAEIKRTIKQNLKVQTEAPIISTTPTSAQQLDAEFLAALPIELRAEIEMQMQQAQQSKGQQQEQAQSNRNVTPPSTSLPSGRQHHAMPQIAADNIFVQDNCIHLLLAWVKSGDAPENYDVELISSHAQELVRVKAIDKLYDPLLYLCRLINCQKGTSADCAWHMAFRIIMQAVQLKMREVYDGRKLFLGAKLKCDKCA